jgi:hypothetical protein
MQSEALRNIRTMRQVKTSLYVARRQKLKTSNSLSKTEEEAAYLLSLTDRRAGQILAKEVRRFAALEASIDKSRGRVLKAREKLAVTINKNRALNELRLELQQARWEGNMPALARAETPTPRPNLHQIELRY